MNRASSLRRLIVITFGFLFVSGCATEPEVKSIRKMPGTSEMPTSILVLAVTNKETIRQVMESSLVSRLEKAGYQAEQYGPDPMLPWKDPAGLRNKVKERLQTSPADGVLTVSLVRTNRRIEYVPNQIVFNPVTVGMGPLASATYIETIDIPAHFEETTEYVLRTTLFDANLGQPMWQMYSSTVDPASLDQAVDGFARVVVREIGNSYEK